MRFFFFSFYFSIFSKYSIMITYTEVLKCESEIVCNREKANFVFKPVSQRI